MQLKIVRFVPESNGRRGQLNTGAVANRKIKAPETVRWRSKPREVAAPDRQRPIERCFLLQGRHVDDEAVFHVALEKTLERFVDLSNPIVSMSQAMPCSAQKSSISCVSAMPPMPEPPTCVAEKQAERLDRQLASRRTHQRHRAVEFQQAEIGVDIVLGRNACRE